MNTQNYILMQRAIFKKYHAENIAVYNIIQFNIMCSEIALYREKTLCYSTIKAIIKIVKKNQIYNKKLLTK